MKISQEQQKKGKQLFEKLVTKSWEDSQFKEALLANPEEVMREASNGLFNLPTGKTIVVEDQSDSTKVYLNIPTKPNMEEVELTEEQLEQVSGGAIPVLVYWAAAAVIGGLGAGYGGTAALD